MALAGAHSELSRDGVGGIAGAAHSELSRDGVDEIADEFTGVDMRCVVDVEVDACAVALLSSSIISNLSDWGCCGGCDFVVSLEFVHKNIVQ